MVDAALQIAEIGQPTAGARVRGRVFAQTSLVLGAAILLAICAIAVLAPALAPHDPYAQDLTRRLIPPLWYPKGDWTHPLGTDNLGRDYLSRTLYGARISLLIGLSVMVIEGTGAKALRRAAGHIAGTALPGQPGNIGISAHRDTFFRPLRNIRQDDIITLTTMGGEYRYRVVSTRVVNPSGVEVLGPSQTEVLTLVTCYPFYFVGSAPQRFIVRAERVGKGSPS